MSNFHKPNPVQQAASTAPVVSLPSVLQPQNGLVLLTKGPTGSGKTTAISMFINKNNGVSDYRLPDVDEDGVLTDADNHLYDEAVARLTKLMQSKYEDDFEYFVVNNLLERPRTPGILAAILFSEQYLSSGGKIEALSTVGRIFLPSRIDHLKVDSENVEALSRLCEALYEEFVDDEFNAELLKIAVRDVETAVAVESIVSERGVTDATSVRELLATMTGVKTAVQDGVL